MAENDSPEQPRSRVLELSEIADHLRDGLKPIADDLPSEPVAKLATLMVAAALVVPVDSRDFERAVAAASHVLANYAKSGGPEGTVH